MALPLTRNTTYTPASPVLSADLNALQDMIIGRKHGLVQRNIPAAAGIGTIPLAGGIPGVDYVGSSTAVQFMYWDLGLEVGTTIVSIGQWRFGNGVTDANFRLIKCLNNDPVTGLSTVGTVDALAAAAAWTFTAVPAGLPATIAVGEVYRWYARANGANIRLGTVELTYQKT